jgi:hypothetical protein
MPTRHGKTSPHYHAVGIVLRFCLTAPLILGVALYIALASLAWASDPNPDLAGLGVEIDKRVADLGVKPRDYKLASEKAFDARRAISNGQYSTAREIILDVLKHSELQYWRFYPFTDFMSGITDVNDPEFLTRLNEWVNQTSGDSIPHLIRAQYYHDLGWFVRGLAFAKKIKPEHRADFQTYLERALNDIDTTISLEANPYSVWLKLRILHGFGPSAGLKTAFEDAVLKYPDYYPLYDVVLGTLEPKWGGTVTAMYGFVDQYAGHRAGHAPLKLLYLSLYRDLLDSASNACVELWSDRVKFSQCVTSWMNQAVRPELTARVQDALDLYDHSDNNQFDIAIREILLPMLRSTGGDAYAAGFLQSVAGAINSDTQLKKATQTPGNYVIEEAVSESWYLQGFYDNALKKGQDALKDVAVTIFPDDEAKDFATAQIYQRQAKTYSKLHQFVDMIVYEKAAVMLGNITEDEHYICWGYYQLKDYQATVDACTQALDHNTKNLLAHYWRGVAYQKLSEDDRAVKDLTAVADSESSFRTSAVINLSMIYFDKKDNKTALDILNKYNFVYDVGTQNKSDLAVNYNNRCYAYMELGDLTKALDDCTASLKYGSLPDAYRKEQELLRLLNPN